MFAAKNAFIGKGSTGYNIARSVRFRGSASAYLNKTFASAGNQQKFTMSFWFKRSSLGGLALNVSGWSGSGATQGGGFVYFSNDQLIINQQTNNANDWGLQTNQVFRDPSAWYHLVIAVDTTQATAANRVLVYVNGVQVTSFSSATYPTINLNTKFNATNQRIASSDNGGAVYTTFDGYMAEYNFINAQALTPSSFGAISTNGVWQPARYTGTYGTNGFYLKFADNSTAAALGTDSSGNGNTWTVNNISVTAGTTYDSMTDVPTLTSATAANYCVMNPLSNIGTGNLYTFSNGNLSTTVNVSTGGRGIVSTYGMTSGAGIKYYVEINVTSFGASNNSDYGILNTSTTVMTTGSFVEAGCIGAYLSNGYAMSATGKVMNNGSTLASGLATFVDGDIVQIAYDGTNIYFGRNGTWLNSAVPASGTGGFSVAAGTYGIAMGASANTTKTSTANFNFGQRPFTYTAPTGFVALNTYNLSTPTIANGAAYMAATLYTGTLLSNTISNAVNSVSFQPDFVWIKSRSAATDNKLTDVVRGVTKALISNTTGAETTDTFGLTAFNSNGFTVSTDTTYNNSAATYVAWQWKANGTGVSNTDGSITSTVSAGATQGFAVVTYTGTGAAATVGHGLGNVPSMIIVKKRSGLGTTWAVYNVNIGAANSVSLNSTAASSDQNYWNSTTPTSSVWSMTGNAEVNGSAETYVAYCFAPIAGFSAFGSYTGNGSTDGPFVYLGFKPRWIMLKKTNAIGNWSIIDTSRQNYNVEGPYLNPNLSDAETTGSTIYDMLSNGFKLRATTGVNDSGATFIYAAFAENPFKYALAR